MHRYFFPSLYPLSLLNPPLSHLVVPLSVATNYQQYSAGGVLSIAHGLTSSSLAVSGYPMATIDYRTAVYLTMTLSHPSPAALTITLFDPAGKGVIIGSQIPTSCVTYYTTAVFDNSTASSSQCPPPNITANGTDQYTTLSPSSLSSLASTPAPFAVVFANSAVNGLWRLNITSTSLGIPGTLTSWSLRFFSRPLGFFLSFFFI